MWPNRRIVDLLGIDFPIIQAPMAGTSSAEMAIAVSEAGGLGSLPCAMLTADEARAELEIVRQRTSRPINVNFLCHTVPKRDAARKAAWRKRLGVYYTELGLDVAAAPPAARMPFDAAMCDLVVELKPAVVSFHFGLPDSTLLEGIKSTGAKIWSSANSVEEARWLEREGCDAVIAQGYEAGGHHGMFLTQDIASQVGTLALVPQVVDAIKVPVIAAGGIADARGVAAAFALGAAAVQMGTAYLLCPEAKTNALHRAALKSARDNQTVLTNVFTGRPARSIVNRLIREVGPISDLAPEFPLAADAVVPLRAKSEALGSKDFMLLLSGQFVAPAHELPAGELTRKVAAETLELLQTLSGSATV
jgi:nitronate monooxygenase